MKDKHSNHQVPFQAAVEQLLALDREHFSRQNEQLLSAVETLGISTSKLDEVQKKFVTNLKRRIRRTPFPDYEGFHGAERVSPNSLDTDQVIKPGVASNRSSFGTQKSERRERHSVTLQEWMRLSGHWSYSFPVTKAITLADVPDPLLDSSHPVIQFYMLDRPIETGILASYNVQWSPKAVFRDVWQNFYDGHCQTLEGVRCFIKRSNKSLPYEVTIEGGAEYPFQLLIDLGGTSKAGMAETAGHFGEGAKIVALCMLRDLKAAYVRYSSLNWSLEFTLRGDMLYYQVSEVPVRCGNRLEVGLREAHHVHILWQSSNNFFSPNNPEFKNPTFQNHIGGFKYMPGELGKVFVGGQVYQVGTASTEDYQGAISDYCIWLHRKGAAFSKDRDRSGLKKSEVTTKIVRPLVESMTDKELTDVLFELRPEWPDYDVSEQDEFVASLLRSQHNPSICDAVVNEIGRRGLKICFPSNYVAVKSNLESTVPDNERRFLKRHGIELCHALFSDMGMRLYDDQFILSQLGDVFEPTPLERHRVGVLREAMKFILRHWNSANTPLAQVNLKFKLSSKDIHRPVVFFEPTKGSLYYGREEFFIDQLIFWQQGSLQSLSFEEALRKFCVLHMLKFGDEQSELSSYALTDFLTYTLSSTLSPIVREQLKACERLWNV